MEARRFFCAGAYPALQRTLFVSRFVPGAVNRSNQVRLDVAGKAVNAARALQRLGGHPVLAGFSGGSSGSEVERLLKEEELDYGGFLRVDAPVRICQTILPSDGSPFTELVEEGPALGVQMWEALCSHCCDQMQQIGGGVAILAGTMPRHASLDFYPTLIRAANMPVILDTSGRALLAALSAKPAVVKINADELRVSCALDGVDSTDIVAMARHLLGKGAGCVGVTRGARDAFLVTDHCVWSYEIPAVKVVSALGSGDCVNAGMAEAIARGEALEKAFAFGLACGTANAEVAQPGGIRGDRACELACNISLHAR